MRAHSCQPFQRMEHFILHFVFGQVFHLLGILMIGHSFLGERCANNIAGQLLYGFFISGQNAMPGEYIKSGMPPFTQ